MDIQYYGANCVRITNKKVSLVIDDTLQKLGAKSCTQATDIALFTQKDPEQTSEARFVIDSPGEYEISEVSIRGVAVRRHTDTDEKNATVYSIQIADLSLGVIGHIDPNLTDDQLEDIGLIDILFIPVGGSGYTLDPTGAVQVIKKIEPKVVIPTHFADNKLNYEVPQVELDKFLHEIGAADTSPVAVFKAKRSELLDKTQVVVLERQ